MKKNTLFLLIIFYLSLSSFGQNKSLQFTSWAFSWDSLCNDAPLHDYCVFFPNSIVINYTLENDICSMGKYTLQDSLVFMKVYCDERNFYSKIDICDTVQYVAVIKEDTLRFREMWCWRDGKYKQSSFKFDENYIFIRKYTYPVTGGY